MSGKACARPVGEIEGADHARVFYHSHLPEHALSMHPDLCDACYRAATVTFC